MFSNLRRANVAILSLNITILIGRLLWAIRNCHKQIVCWNSLQICKQRLWFVLLANRKQIKESKPLDWSIFLSIVQVCFQMRLSISTSNLLVFFANCPQQSAHQNCNIVGQILQCWLYEINENVRCDCQWSSVIMLTFLVLLNRVHWSLWQNVQQLNILLNCLNLRKTSVRLGELVKQMILPTNYCKGMKLIDW